jgi:hypothetical protein
MSWLDWPCNIKDLANYNPLSMLDWQTTVYEQMEKQKRERREAERKERISLGVTIAQVNHRGVWTDDER